MSTSHCRDSSALVLIDAAIEQYQHLVKGMQPSTEVIVLDPTQDGIVQITQALSDRPALSSLHIVSHGRSGELQLGSTQLNQHTIGSYAHQIRSWVKSFQHNAEILLYGCELAAGAIGQKFIQQINRLTGVAVAASTTLTGSAALGGSWEFDYQSDDAVRRRSPVFAPQALATYPAVLATLVDESFRGADVANKPWLFGAGGASANPFLTARTGTAPSVNGLPGSGVAIDTPGSGALRLTNATANQAAFVIYNAPIAANGGVSITFDFFAYNGVSFGNPPSNGDGISFFLIDGAAAPTTAGAFGGSLGYAQKQVEGISGIAGGYLGVGLDEFGNFSTSVELNGQQRPTPVGVATPVQDSVAVRGSQASGYAFLTGTGTLTPGIDTPASASRDPALRRAKIDLTPTGVLNVQVDLNGNNSFIDAGEQVITNFNVATANGALPATFKFGFASSTGAATNVHEVRNLLISTFTDPPVTADATVRVTPGTTTNLTGLSATDLDGAIATFTISTVPPAAEGALFLGNPSSGGTAVVAGQVLTPAQIGQLFFRPSGSFTGASFTYRATDNQGSVDSTPATVTLNRSTGTNRPPILPQPTLNAINPGGTSNLIGLTGRDPDGRITSYTITSLPPAGQGLVYLGNPRQGGRLVTAGRALTPAQVNRLFFQAGAGFTGTSFIYRATDNDGDSTTSTITLGASTIAPSTCKPGRTLRGNAGQNRIQGTRNSDTLLGFASNDVLNGRGCDDRILGGRGRDRLFGASGRDRLNGNGGNDRLNGGSRADNLSGGLGRDFLNGATGSDRLAGARGDDTLRGGNGADGLDGGLGRDRLLGGNGNDRLNGRQDRDFLNGELGDDVLSGGLGNDRLNGGRKQDQLNGGRGNDVCFGSGGSDVILGGRDRDRLLGGTQPDRLLGGAGGDFIVGGGGADVLTGGLGRDQFVFRAGQKGVDTLTDFEIARRGGAIDKIDLSRILRRSGYSRINAFSKYVKLAPIGDGAIVRVDLNGNSAGGFKALMTLEGIVPSSLSAKNFLV